MKIVAGLFAMVLIISILVVAALVQLMITLAPFLAVATIVALVLRARRRPQPSIAAARTEGARQVRAVSPPRYLIGAPAVAPNGWTMVPVWVAPAPCPPIIDGETIGDG